MLVLAWVVLVWQWQDPFTALYTKWEQRQLSSEYAHRVSEYRIVGHRIVGAKDLAVLKSHGREVVALQACHPRFFATHRYIA